MPCGAVSDRMWKLWYIDDEYTLTLGYMRIASVLYAGPRRNITCKPIGACTAAMRLR